MSGILGALEKGSSLGMWLSEACMEVRGYSSIPLHFQWIEGTVDRFWPGMIEDGSWNGTRVIKFEGQLPDEPMREANPNMDLGWTPYLDVIGNARGDLGRSLLIYDDWELRSVRLAVGQPRWRECRVEFGE